MNPLLKETLKSTIIGIGIGVALSFLLPGFGGLINMPGAVGDMSSPVWMGGFMGLFNGISTLLTSGFDLLFSSKPADVANAQQPAQKAPQVMVAIEAVRPLAPEVMGTHVARLMKSREMQVSQLVLA